MGATSRHRGHDDPTGGEVTGEASQKTDRICGLIKDCFRIVVNIILLTSKVNKM